jgi:hypothetical protein
MEWQLLGATSPAAGPNGPFLKPLGICMGCFLRRIGPLDSDYIKNAVDRTSLAALEKFSACLK